MLMVRYQFKIKKTYYQPFLLFTTMKNKTKRLFKVTFSVLGVILLLYIAVIAISRQIHNTIDEEKVIALTEEMKTWEDAEHGFSWEDVANSMIDYPDEVKTDGLCASCLSTRIKLRFVSPAWTWEELCGRSGDMTICPKCHTQTELYGRIIMN